MSEEKNRTHGTGSEELLYVRPASEIVSLIGHDADSFFRHTEMMFIEPLKDGLNAVVMLAEFGQKGHKNVPFPPDFSQFAKLVVAQVGKQPTSMMTTIGPVSRDIGHAFLGAIAPERIPRPQNGHARYKMASAGQQGNQRKEVYSYVKRGDYVTVIDGSRFDAADMFLCVTEARTVMHILTRDGLVLKDDGLDHELEKEEGKLRFLPVAMPQGIRAHALVTLPGPYGANLLVATNQGVRDLNGRVYCHTNNLNVTAMVAHPTENIIYFVGDGKLYALNHTDDGRVSTVNAAELGACDIEAYDTWKIFAGPQIRYKDGPGVLVCGWKGTAYSSSVLSGTTTDALL